MPPRRKRQRSEDDVPLATPSSSPETVSPAKSATPEGALTPDASSPDTLAGVVKRAVLKGRLQTLPEIALEIQLLASIYGELESRDLHHLSRTCKKFRKFFLDRKTNEKLWVQARENAKTLPQRPPFMTEPAFIHLLYTTNCNGCGSPNVRKILHGWFVRLCTKCTRDRTVWYEHAFDEVRAEDCNLTLSAIFDLGKLQKYLAVQNYLGRSYNKRHNRLFKAHVAHILDRFRALVKPVTEAVKKAFLDAVIEDHRNRSEYVHAISAWLELQDRGRDAQLGVGRKERFEAIIVNLREAGWDKEVDFLGADGIEAMSNLPVVRQSSKLTAGAWQKVLIVLDTLLNDTRMKRLDKELRHVLRARFNTLEDAIVAQYVTLPRTARMDCRPRYIDFAFTPECRAIIDVPTAEIITADQFAAVLPILALRWDADRKQELTDYILTHLPNLTPDVDPLELAVAFFACKTRCQPVFATVRYPAILAHRCLLGDCFRLSSCARDEFEHGDVYTRTTNSLTWSAHDAQAYADGAGLLSVRVPFHLAQLAATGEADARQLMNTMRRIVAALGLDPARATFDELQECGTWLRCVTCETADPADWIRARSWRTACDHEKFHTDGGPPGHARASPVWRCADRDDMFKVRASLLSARLVQGPYLWCCSLCLTFNAAADLMISHLNETHSITDPEEARREGVIYLHPSEDKSCVAYACGPISLRPRVEALRAA